MPLPALAILDVRADGSAKLSGVRRWLRGIGIRLVRLFCGLIMFFYVFSHLFNHALGQAW